MARFSTFLALGRLLTLAGPARGQAPTFAAVAAYPTGSGSGPRSIAVADMNADGRPDLLIANESNTVGVLLGNGNGTFQASTTYATGGSFPVSLAVADVNADTRPDIVTAS
ncbi:MAG: VCBS repeat-containing protein [Hymenobacter sp.]|nr:MAG: VCBS repeat-containing protein [Hymenobacter sp.]